MLFYPDCEACTPQEIKAWYINLIHEFNNRKKKHFLVKTEKLYDKRRRY